MTDFDYGNARLRAMKSRLLNRQALEELADSDSMPELISALTKTPYRDAIEAAVLQYEGKEIIAAALQDNLIHTLSKVRHFYSGRPAELVAWVLRRFDIDNVKTILRGLAQQVAANEILAGTLPIGELQSVDLASLARSAHARAAVDLLATWRISLAQPLLTIRAERPGADLFELELALEQWYFRAVATASKENGRSLRQTLMVQSDVTNILTALRLIDEPDTADFLQQRFTALDAAPLFIGPGHLAFALLIEVTRQESVPRAVEKLMPTSYGKALGNGLEQYRITQRLSEFELALQRHQLTQATNLLLVDPLGIGVLIGFLALKTNELANLRRIYQGVHQGEAPNGIQAELLMVNV